MAKRILVFDDDQDVLDALSILLNSYGYDVRSHLKFSDENLHPSNLPDLIILDLLLAGQNGRIICRNLKTQSKTQNIPILMISAYPEAEATTLNAGADSFMAKPFGAGALMQEIERLTL